MCVRAIAGALPRVQGFTPVSTSPKYEATRFIVDEFEVVEPQDAVVRRLQASIVGGRFFAMGEAAIFASERL